MTLEKFFATFIVIARKQIQFRNIVNTSPSCTINKRVEWVV